jgi:hypothetical protein
MTGAVDLSCWVIMAGGWNGSGFWRIGGIWLGGQTLDLGGVWIGIRRCWCIGGLGGQTFRGCYFTQSSFFLFVSSVFARGGVLELVDAVRARHVTPDISIYCIVAAEPYFTSFRSA